MLHTVDRIWSLPNTFHSTCTYYVKFTSLRNFKVADKHIHSTVGHQCSTCTWPLISSHMIKFNPSETSMLHLFNNYILNIKWDINVTLNNNILHTVHRIFIKLSKFKKITKIQPIPKFIKNFKIPKIPPKFPNFAKIQKFQKFQKFVKIEKIQKKHQKFVKFSSVRNFKVAHKQIKY